MKAVLRDLMYGLVFSVVMVAMSLAVAAAVNLMFVA
jgi:hypothetical protein